MRVVELANPIRILKKDWASEYLMNRKEKEDLIIRLHNEGKSWNYIMKKAKVSPNTIDKVLANDEESRAFALFEKKLSPMQVKIELGIPPENAEKHYLAYKKLVHLVDLSSVYYSLGDRLPDFLDFYNSARLCNISPDNMAFALNLAKNIEFMKQEILNLQTNVQNTRNVSAQEAANLDENRRQSGIAVDNLQKLKTELELVSSAVDKIKNTSDFQVLEHLIHDTVNSLSGEQYFLVEVALIAVMRKIQVDPTLIPLLQFPFPDKLDTTEHAEYHQFTLINLMSKVTKFLPTFLEEMTQMIGNKVLQEIPNLHTISESNSRTLDQSDNEMTHMSRSEGQIILQSQEDFEVTKAVSIPRDEKIDKSAKISIEAILIFHQYANLYNSMDDWWY